MISPEVFPGFDLLYRSLLNCVHVCMYDYSCSSPPSKETCKPLLECILHIGDSGKILTTKGTKLHPFYLKWLSFLQETNFVILTSNSNTIARKECNICQKEIASNGF